MRRVWMGIVAGLWIAACGGGEVEVPPTGPGTSSSGSGGSGAGMVASDLPCDVAELLEERCQQCHAAQPQFGAPMPMVTRDHLLAPSLDGSRTVAEAAIERMGADSRMPPPPNEPATPEEIALLQGWIDAGSPTRPDGETCGSTGTGGGGGGSVDCEPNVNLAPAVPFEMPSTSVDEQVCFGIDIPAEAAKRHITAIVPKIDNSTIIHHILLLRSPTPVSPEPTSCGFTNVDWQLLYAWGPGTPAHVLPEEAGFPIDPNEPGHFVLQIHYNNLQGLSGEVDQSGVDLCTTDQLRTHDADVMAFGSVNFDGLTPMATSRLDCSTPVPGQVASYFPVTIFQSWPHMHTFGTALSSSVTTADGQTIPLADVPDYDFEYQITYPNDVVLNAGDTVNTSCTWQNPTTDVVTFGEDTADEMCFNFVSYYPRIDASFWNWLAPAYLSNCSMSNP